MDQKLNIQVPIFCFDTGANNGEDKRYYNYDGSNYRIKCELTYQKAIIYFRMLLEAKAQKKRVGVWFADGNTSIALAWDYKWVQRCERSSDNQINSTQGLSGPKAQKIAYENAKSLKKYEMYGQVQVQRIGWTINQYFTSGVLHIMHGY
jgi:hypothetical protein